MASEPVGGDSAWLLIATGFRADQSDEMPLLDYATGFVNQLSQPADLDCTATVWLDSDNLVATAHAIPKVHRRKELPILNPDQCQRVRVGMVGSQPRQQAQPQQSVRDRLSKRRRRAGSTVQRRMVSGQFCELMNVLVRDTAELGRPGFTDREIFGVQHVVRAGALHRGHVRVYRDGKLVSWRLRPGWNLTASRSLYRLSRLGTVFGIKDHAHCYL